MKICGNSKRNMNCCFRKEKRGGKMVTRIVLTKPICCPNEYMNIFFGRKGNVKKYDSVVHSA